MLDDDNAYDNPSGTFGGSDTPSAGSDDGAGAGFGTLGSRYSTTWLEPKPFGAQNGWQMNSHDWLKRDTDPPAFARTSEMRDPATWNGATRNLTMDDIAHLPESVQYMMIKTSAPALGNSDSGAGVQTSTVESGTSNEQGLNTNSISPSLLNKFDQEQNSEWWDEQKKAAQTQQPQEQQQPVPPLDYKSHPYYIKALEKVKGENRFTFRGQEYFRHGGATYRAQNTIPNIGRRLSPEEADALDDERAKMQRDLPVEKTDGPIGPISAALATTGISVAGGATLAAGALKGAKSFLRSSLLDFIK